MRISAPALAPTRPSLVSFPQDEGAHPDSKTEWWYLNGHLKDKQGRDYGFIHALFDAPDAIDARYNVDLPAMPSVTALDTGLTRESEGLHSQSWRMHVRPPYWPHSNLKEGQLDCKFKDDNGTLKLRRIDSQTFHIQGPTGDGEVDLRLKTVKPALLMGGEGEIKMGPFGLSKYYTFPRLEAEGTLKVDGETREVSGSAWMDHQWGDMQLYNGYVGWDWFGIQLDNQTEINAFRFRDEEGGNASATVGISRADGSQEVTEDLRLTAGRTARSPQTGAEYPVEWHLSLPEQKIELDVKATVDQQEMMGHPPHSHPELALKPTYWEGSVRVAGTMQGQPVSGRAYMELVGYPGEGIFARKPSELTPETIELAQRLASQAQPELA